MVYCVFLTATAKFSLPCFLTNDKEPNAITEGNGSEIDSKLDALAKNQINTKREEIDLKQSITWHVNSQSSDLSV